MVALRELNLGQNKIGGTIPDTVGKLTDLASLVITDNDFTGTVPDVWGDSHAMKNLFLNNNARITGRLEKMFCDWSPNEYDEGITVDIRGTNITCYSSCWDQLLKPDPLNLHDEKTDHLFKDPSQGVCPAAPTKMPTARISSPTSAPGPSHPTAKVQTPPGYLAFDEVAALKDMFDSMGGLQWRWRSGKGRVESKAGIAWDFSPAPDVKNADGSAAQVLANDPCRVHWEGVQCDCHSFPTDAHADGFYYDDDSKKDPVDTRGKCSVSKLQLIGYGLKGPLPKAVWAFGAITHAQV